MSVLIRIIIVIAAQASSESSESEHPPQIRCGAASLCVAAQLCGVSVSQSELADVLGDRMAADDVSLAEIKAAAEKLGLVCEPATFSSLADIDHRAPLIISIRQQPPATKRHFVVLYGGAPSHAQILDYPWLPRAIPPEALERIWNGKGLYITSRGSPQSDRALNRYATRTIGLIAAVVAILGTVCVFRVRRETRRMHTTLRE